MNRPLHFSSGGDVLDIRGNVLTPDDARWLAAVLTDEFHAALKRRDVPSRSVVELAKQVDHLNTAIDEQRDWRKAGAQ